MTAEGQAQTGRERHIKTIQHQDGLKKRANCQDWRSTLKGCLMGLASIPDRSLTEFCLSLFHTMTSSSHLCFPGNLHWDYSMNLSIQIPCQLFLKKHTVKNSPKTPLSTANPHYSSDLLPWASGWATECGHANPNRGLRVLATQMRPAGLQGAKWLTLRLFPSQMFKSCPSLKATQLHYMSHACWFMRQYVLLAKRVRESSPEL